MQMERLGGILLRRPSSLWANSSQGSTKLKYEMEYLRRRAAAKKQCKRMEYMSRIPILRKQSNLVSRRGGAVNQPPLTPIVKATMADLIGWAFPPLRVAEPASTAGSYSLCENVEIISSRRPAGRGLHAQPGASVKPLNFP